MKWIGISGSWRTTSPAIERAVRKTARDMVLAGDGIVTGGALNVDYQVTDEVLALKRPEKIITHKQAENLITQLTELKEQNSDGLNENFNNAFVERATYYERNQTIIDASDELIAFQVNESKGTQDAIDKARAKGIPVTIHSYKVE